MYALIYAMDLNYFDTLRINTYRDPDGDGMSNRQEYLAGTNPTNSADKLKITAFNLAPGGTNVSLTWSTVPTRCYLIEKATDLDSSVWSNSSLGLITPSGSSTTRAFSDTNAPERFYRTRAVRPLAP